MVMRLAVQARERRVDPLLGQQVAVRQHVDRRHERFRAQPLPPDDPAAQGIVVPQETVGAADVPDDQFGPDLVRMA